MGPQRDLLEFKGEPPQLERPFLVVHLTGWTDSGVAGQTAIGFLQARWNARTTAPAGRWSAWPAASSRR
jgi:hypothetical protein